MARKSGLESAGRKTLASLQNTFDNDAKTPSSGLHEAGRRTLASLQRTFDSDATGALAHTPPPDMGRR